MEELSIICGFAILFQWTMELVDHLHGADDAVAEQQFFLGNTLQIKQLKN